MYDSPDNDHYCQMNEGVVASPAVEAAVSALELSDKWLCDSGTTFDLVSSNIAQKKPQAIGMAKDPIKMNTANGVYTADRILSMQTPGLGPAGGQAFIMKTTPSALSVGQRVMKH